MAAAVHSNVGLLHATMAIFNAWCDRMPVLVIGATGPVDAAKRRPWIDWIHTARDQGAIVRGYTKWDDQPASPEAARESMLRAFWIANAPPQGPAYVVLDAGNAGSGTEDAIASGGCRPLDPARGCRSIAPDAIATAAAVLDAGRSVVILAGRASRQHRSLEGACRARRTAQRSRRHRSQDRRDLSDRSPAACRGTGVLTPVAEALEALAEADVILSLDWVDSGRHVAQPQPRAAEARMIQVSLDHTVHNGWSMDHQGLPPVDLFMSPPIPIPPCRIGSERCALTGGAGMLCSRRRAGT